MADRILPAQRSANMAAIRGRDTGPEIAVRRLLSDLGIRYRLHVAGLPGRPDIVMKNKMKTIEVRGCFWHQHTACRYAYKPKSNRRFWLNKFRRNVERDLDNEKKLKGLGYGLLVVWECQIKNSRTLSARLKQFCGTRPATKRRSH